MAAFKAETRGASTKTSLGQSTLMVHLERMLVTWMDHRKRQGLSVTFSDTKNKAIECYEHLKANETGPVPEFVTSTGWFYNFKARHAFRSVKQSGEAKSADAAASYQDKDHHQGGSGTSPSRRLIWMRRACSGRGCLNAHTSHGGEVCPRI